jgi:hypothetical protein
MLSGASQDRPVIVGWSTAPRGQVIKESLGQLPKKLAAGPRVLAKDRIITHPIGDETGWTTARSLGKVGATSVRSKPVCFCSDCTFLDEIHRAALKKKLSSRKAACAQTSSVRLLNRSNPDPFSTERMLDFSTPTYRVNQNAVCSPALNA